MEFLIAALLAAQVPRPIRPNGALPVGQRIEVKDGDTVVMRGGARVRLVQRREARIRSIFNPGQRWLILIFDYAEPDGGTPDGLVDGTYRYDEVDGAWPLGERWEGNATIDNYSMAQGPPGAGIGLSANGVFVQVLQRVDNGFADTSATTILTAGSGGGGSAVMGGPGQRTFDFAEQRSVAEAVAHAQGADTSTRTMIGPGGATFTTRVGMSIAPSPDPYPAPQAPVRVGGNIATPRKIADARPVLPPLAQQANVQGAVILEIVIGADGTVSDAKILRSIPLLDQAALDAVRQWRYEPTWLNGRPVPVIMTVTVPFQ
jgi:TonB family protein